MGSVTDPWGVDLSPYNIPGTAGKRIKELLTTNNFIGLK